METISEQYRRLHPRSAELSLIAKNMLPDGVTHDARRFNPFSIYINHASGARKWDVDGNEYVDYRMGHGALILGHSHPQIVKVVQDQMAKGTHYGLSHELEILWSQWVKYLLPSVEKIRFHSSGTEATLMALRLARAYTGKNKVLKFDEHFHGWHDYVTAGSPLGTSGVPQPVLDTMISIPHNDIDLVEATLEQDNDVAAVIVEPTGAHMGLYPTFPQFLRNLRETTERHGVLLILDEVVTGFRTSSGGAQKRYGVKPDLTTLAKILGGGLPGGAVAGRADIINMIQTREESHGDTKRRVPHPGTFNANPLSAAAGCMALELVATTAINSAADEMAQKLRDGLNSLLQKSEIPGCARGVSSMVHLQIGNPCTCDRSICTLSTDQIREGTNPRLFGLLLRAGLNAGVDWMNTNFIVSASHTTRDINDTLAAFEKAFSACRNEGIL